MIQKVEASREAGKMRGAIVVSRFNEFVTAKLRDGARDCLQLPAEQSSTGVPASAEAAVGIRSATCTPGQARAHVVTAAIRFGRIGRQLHCTHDSGQSNHQDRRDPQHAVVHPQLRGGVPRERGNDERIRTLLGLGLP